jgi:ABC-type sugar transport system ATPase subunit
VVKDFERENPRRVALSRAIAKGPRVFLLDEPLSNLDAVLRERMRLELKTLFSKLKATVIYVTHDQVEAMSLSDKIAVIDKGRIRQFGAPEELYERPADLFVASFIGSPRMNMFQVRVAGKHFVYGSQTWQIPEEYLSEKLGNILVLNLKWQDTVLRVSSTKKEKDDRTHDLWVEFDRHRLLFFDTVMEKLLEDQGESGPSGK